METKKSIIESILSTHTKDTDYIEVTKEKFINCIIESDNIAKALNISYYTLSKLSKRLFPNKSKGKLRNYILSLENYKFCVKCDSYLKTSEFNLNRYNSDGLNSSCRACHLLNSSRTQASRQAKYRAFKTKAIPPWANLVKIKEIYDNCPQGFHVDHIFPLNGKYSSGLHVENNLQYLPASENLEKGNKV